MVVNLRAINRHALKSMQESEFALPRENIPSPSLGSHAAVSSFAFQGTNASASIEIHAALTPPYSRQRPMKPKYLFVVPLIHPGLESIRIGTNKMASCIFTLRPQMAGLNDHRIENVPILPGAYSVDLLLHLHAYLVNPNNKFYALRSMLFLRLVEIKDDQEILGRMHGGENITIEVHGKTNAQFCRAEITQM
jgi:hypothetical protein